MANFLITRFEENETKILLDEVKGFVQSIMQTLITKSSKNSEIFALRKVQLKIKTKDLLDITILWL